MSKLILLSKISSNSSILTTIASGFDESDTLSNVTRRLWVGSVGEVNLTLALFTKTICLDENYQIRYNEFIKAIKMGAPGGCV